jgi:hypothetical protein
MAVIQAAVEDVIQVGGWTLDARLFHLDFQELLGPVDTANVVNFLKLEVQPGPRKEKDC